MICPLPNSIFCYASRYTGGLQYQEINETYPKALIKTIQKVTEGQANTAKIGIDELNTNVEIKSCRTIGHAIMERFTILMR